ncbi:MAG: flavin reductase [Oscillospiraceae bacterium]|nr:flavin reductase [Oscillospiraceae bacterium]
MDKTAFYKLSYGLYLLTARAGEKENGCIINTAIQCASEPKLISICVINKNLTCDMIRETGKFNISVLTEDTPFTLFQRFGMQSGRDVDKFAGDEEMPLMANDIRYLPSAAAVFACRVVSSTDLGSHTLFIAEPEDAISFSDKAPMTYAYYQANVKSAGAKKAVSGWRCKVCGYVYEGEELPADFECPLCHHGPEDFEKIGPEAPAAPKKWICTVCGHIHEGPEPPAECPVCHVGPELFEEYKG